ncbi:MULTISPECIES: sulfurtransferase TusA family protein [unclassified Thioalkalivibrio]|uniref:sulfurtransferase TusA family protein n=1 Tax=unclassified Thioalkalivibrio TaxID=2621013 RepID=UPI00036DAFD9|nr:MULTISPECIES: sulfurtransferase TusA family protein [unclassified Thioalkalivibrio]
MYLKEGEMWWRFGRRVPGKTISADIREHEDGTVSIDVRGQTCPGYLLSINQAMDRLAPGTNAVLLTTYAPCGDDVNAWCKEKGYVFSGLSRDEDIWKIAVTKPEGYPQRDP